MGAKVVIIMGSKSDIEFAQKIKSALSTYSISVEMRIASAHRNPEYLLRLLREYASKGDSTVFITVAGLSDALSGVVAAQRLFPVIACPPDLERYQLLKVFSSAFTPSDVPVAFVSDPSKAAHFAAQILALGDSTLLKTIHEMTQTKRDQIEQEDAHLNQA
ncbi:MAG: AIR carboxylase family protein [Thaumarchaeota archaeon]|nr:AIR carboxylase family protein [Nitrososphaerota archaeon]